MLISRLQILNFRNFQKLDVSLSRHMILVGENRIGKTNLIHALRLVLDPSLPDSARALKAADIWDGASFEDAPSVEVHVDFREFESDPALLALLTDFRIASDHTTVRLSYAWRKKVAVVDAPKSEADYEFLIYGGGDETRSVRPDVRRRICTEYLHALRDAESELGNWRTSPLRPLLADAIANVPTVELNAISSEVTEATEKLGALAPIQDLEMRVRTGISHLTGAAQDVHAKLGFAPTDPGRLFRSIGLYIDDGKRSIADASVGSANLSLLAIKLAEFEWWRERNERNFTVLCVEEPEAHLHPHLQRNIFQRLFGDVQDEPISLYLTTHAPIVASVAPLRAVVLLKAGDNGATCGYSLAALDLTDDELEDLNRYLTATRAEILFSRGVIFVEGDAEATLVPALASAAGIDLDALGISICSVGGVHFAPYVKLALALSLPYSVITDWDPLDGSKAPLGQVRALDLADLRRIATSEPKRTIAERAALAKDSNALRVAMAAEGVFLNSSTLEIELTAVAPLCASILETLSQAQLGPKRAARIEAWRKDVSTIDSEQLMSIISDIGKGRFASKLAKGVAGKGCPDYILKALQNVASPNA